MKRLLCIVLITSLCLALVFSGCACKHDWNGITGLCESCGEACTHVFDAKSRCTVCRFNCKHTNHNSDTLLCAVCGATAKHDFRNGVCTTCGKETVFVYDALDEKYAQPSDKPGTVVEFHYSTYAYNIASLAGVDPEQIPVEKRAYVYLPNGYEESKQYNVIYLLHGSGGNEQLWFGIGEQITGDNGRFVDTVNMLDNVFAWGEAEGCIIVTPTLYTHVPGDSAYAQYNTEGEEANLSLFYLELTDLITAVESTYSTYTGGDVSYDNLVATRAHRAYAGLSRGGRTCYNSIVCNGLDLFGYLGAFSGSGIAFDKVSAAFTETWKDYPVYYFYNGEGTIDSAHAGHVELYEQMVAQLGDVLREGENLVMVDKYNHGHNSESWYIDLYNILQVFFKQ